MDDWEKFNEVSLIENGHFYSHVTMDDITDANYVHAKIVRKDFETKHLGEYHELYVQSETLLLVDAFWKCNISICLRARLNDTRSNFKLV